MSSKIRVGQMSCPAMCTGKSPILFRLWLGSFGRSTVVESYKTIQTELLLMPNTRYITPLCVLFLSFWKNLHPNCTKTTTTKKQTWSCETVLFQSGFPRRVTFCSTLGTYWLQFFKLFSCEAKAHLPLRSHSCHSGHEEFHCRGRKMPGPVQTIVSAA